MISKKYFRHKDDLHSKKENMLKFGKRLKFLRLRANLSQRALAYKINRKCMYISKMENGITPIPSYMLIRICEELNIHLGKFDIRDIVKE